MQRRRFGRLLAIAAIALLPGCASLYFERASVPAGIPPQYALGQLPHDEYWTGVVFNGEKVGFTRLRIDRVEGDPNRFEIRGESAMQFRLLGLDKRFALRATDRVNADLSLVAFDYEYHLDGNRLALDGEIRDGTLRMNVRNADRVTSRSLNLEGPVYPASALALLPVVRGLKIGTEWRVAVFIGESQEVVNAVQRVVAYEESELLPQPGWKIATRLLGLGTSTWYDAQGRPQLEIALNGVIISYLENESRARQYLAEAALSKRETLVDLSLVRVEPAIHAPREVKFARLEIEGPANLHRLPQDHSQRCVRSAPGVVCEVQAIPFNRAHAAADDGLAASAQVPWADPTIRKLGSDIAGAESTPDGKVRALLAWIRSNIRKEAADAFSALDVLEQRRGECQGHALLFAALARSQGIPTRVVNGLVYSEEAGGFLYHTWNESQIGENWISIDPTFGQPQADAARLKISHGEGAAGLFALSDWIGRTRIRVPAYR